eukprot:gi/632986549/ref/XP_007910302.1/ PREDICTED: DDB1- and CUL4-associated factor 15 [Callorhinchus milii]
MAPSAKKRPVAAAKRKTNVLRSLHRLKITGQFSHRMFQNLPPILCVPLKNIVDDVFLLAGHIFLGFTKCGRYVLSYTREQVFDELPDYVYYLYWWKFNIHDKLKQVRQIRLFKDQEVYSDLYLTVCEWPSDPTKLIVFGFNIRSVYDLLINMVMSDENDRDIYITAVAAPPFTQCPDCRDTALLTTDDPNTCCLQHGFMLHTKFQVVYPFPTFQPAFQLKKDGVVLLNTSYSLVACAISVNTTGDKGQVLYSKSCESQERAGEVEEEPVNDSLTPSPPPHPHRGPCEAPCLSAPGQCCTLHRAEPGGCSEGEMSGWEFRERKHQAPGESKAKEFAADIFRRARAATNGGVPEETLRPGGGGAGAGHGEDVPGHGHEGPAASSVLAPAGGSSELPVAAGCTCPGPGGSQGPADRPRGRAQAEPGAWDTGSPHPDKPQPHNSPHPDTEPGYVNYTKLHYVLEPSANTAQDDGYDDDKISLPFVVTDLKGRNLKQVKESASYQGKYLTVEQLILDFEYVINEVIRNDAAWSKRYCSFSDYDIVILEVCPITNHVIINIGLLLLAYPSEEEGQIR